MGDFEVVPKYETNALFSDDYNINRIQEITDTL